MDATSSNLKYTDVHDERGVPTGRQAQFTEVKLVADHVTELHRTLEADHSITQAELPGVVNVYLSIDGGLIPFDQIKAAAVLEAIGKAQASASADAAAQPQE